RFYRLSCSDKYIFRQIHSSLRNKYSYILLYFHLNELSNITGGQERSNKHEKTCILNNRNPIQSQERIMSKDNILLLPNTIAEMELEIESLMQKKDFENALNNLELLLKHNHCTYIVYRDTLTCLMKLHHTNEDVDLCEKLLMDKQSEFYFDYFEFYIILLYESEAYSTLIHVFETENNNMPHEYADKTEKFKVLALQMSEWKQEKQLYNY